MDFLAKAAFSPSRPYRIAAWLKPKRQNAFVMKNVVVRHTRNVEAQAALSPSFSLWHRVTTLAREYEGETNYVASITRLDFSSNETMDKVKCDIRVRGLLHIWMSLQVSIYWLVFALNKYYKACDKSWICSYKYKAKHNIKKINRMKINQFITAKPVCI